MTRLCLVLSVSLLCLLTEFLRSAVTGEQEEAATALRQIGAILKTDGSSSGRSYTEADLTVLKKPLTAKELSPLRRLATLRRLKVRNFNSDVFFENISSLLNLEQLEVINCDVTDAGLKHFRMLHKLKELRFILCFNIGNEGVSYLEGLTQLENLELADSKVGDAGLKTLRRLSRLRNLDLSSTEVSDEGLESLSAFQDLEVLSLRGNVQLTDKCLEHLKKLPKVRWVKLDSTQVTDKGIADFRTLRPAVKIFND